MALLYDASFRSSREYGDALAGKVIVDISNPFNATGTGPQRGDLDRAGSCQEGPASASAVKAFNTIFRNVLERGRPNVFIAGDNVNSPAEPTG
jgi:predicted dinucleotide-binding enzyme